MFPEGERVKIMTLKSWWFMPVILAPREAEIKRIAVKTQP
jgi:hypothetical protein